MEKAVPARIAWGWLGIVLPEDVGGFGGNFVDASIILERFGTTLVSEPFAESVLVAAHPIALLGSVVKAQGAMVILGGASTRGRELLAAAGEFWPVPGLTAARGSHHFLPLFQLSPRTFR